MFSAAPLSTLGHMDVQLLYFDGCPSWQIAERRLRTALEQTDHSDTVITLEKVTTVEEAVQRHFLGSPTIFINGVDSFASPDDEPAMACRVYPSEAGLEGSPSIEQLVRALTNSPE